MNIETAKKLEHGFCRNCQSFTDYNEVSGRGWCEKFNHYVRKEHSATEDCIVNDAIFKDPFDPDWELNQPHPPFEVGDRVKLIDSNKTHQQWRTYTVTALRHNPEVFQSVESYLQETEWYLEIEDADGNSREVKENDICLAENSHLICTEEIF